MCAQRLDIRSAQGTVRSVEERDLDMVRDWRNQPAIRRVMLTRHKITPEEHLAWFRRSGANPEIALCIVDVEDTPIGFFQLTGVKPGGIAEWGFYAGTNSPRGSGAILGRSALRHAFKTLELHKIEGQALAFNEASIRFHERLGFRKEGVLRQHCKIGDEYVDLVCFGLLKEEFLE